MNIIIAIILTFLGIVYFLASEVAMFIYVIPDQDDEYDSKLESKRFVKALLLIPVAPIIGPYFIYKVLKGENIGTQKHKQQSSCILFVAHHHITSHHNI